MAGIGDRAASDPEALESLRTRRFSILLAAQLLLLLLGPLVTGPVTRLAVSAAFSFVLGAALYSIVDERRLRIFAVSLALPAFVALWADRVVDLSWLPTVEHLLMAAFFAAVAVGMVRHALADGRVGAARVIAALCSYLMLGFLWGELYALVAHLTPGAFSLPAHLAEGGGMGRFSTSVYFSYVTLTTLGFGDVVPVSPMARSLTVSEAIVGQLFLAVLVARLVGLHAANAAGARGADRG